jgi:hypothetical protein
VSIVGSILCLFLQAFNGTRTGADCSQNSCGYVFRAARRGAGSLVHFGKGMHCSAVTGVEYSRAGRPKGHTESSP